MSSREYGARTGRPAKARTSVARETRPTARLERPQSRLSNRMTWKPRSTSVLAEVDVPPGHRPAEPHHQQQGLVVGVAEGLVAELDLTPDRREQLLGSCRSVMMKSQPNRGCPTTVGYLPVTLTAWASQRRRAPGGTTPRWAPSSCRRGSSRPRPIEVLRESQRGPGGRASTPSASLDERRRRWATSYADRAAAAPRGAGDPGPGVHGRRRHPARHEPDAAAPRVSHLPVPHPRQRRLHAGGGRRARDPDRVDRDQARGPGAHRRPQPRRHAGPRPGGAPSRT